MANRADFIARIEQERLRQFNLPGSEYDMRNSPNDWIAIAIHYLSEEVRRGHTIPTQEAFEDSLVKAGAVILAALEHTEVMANKGTLR